MARKTKNVKDGDFMAKIIERRREAHPEKPCECWDCLRAIGLTPPMKMRSKFKCQFPRPWHEVSGPGVDIPGVLNHNTLVQGQREVTESTEAPDKLAGVRV